MKPRNFPGNRARRLARVKFLRGGEPLTDDERRLLTEPKDQRIRMGHVAREESLFDWWHAEQERRHEEASKREPLPHRTDVLDHRLAVC